MMVLAKRTVVLILTVFTILLLFYKWPWGFNTTSRKPSQQSNTIEGHEYDAYGLNIHKDEDEHPQESADQISNLSLNNAIGSATSFYPAGRIEHADQRYTRGLVIGRLASENTAWLDEYLKKDQSLTPFIYVVDDPKARLHTPINKGHEAMAYLTYIIDHYDSLPDVSIFMHPHQKAWHTPELLNHDATELLRRLSSETVTREGYMNLRCHWDPGCPERVFFGQSSTEYLKWEEAASKAAWAEMFPEDPVPDAVGAPCCAQFAVAKHRIQQIPRAKFEKYRQWLINTKESDWVTGRVFEYLWQKIFTNEAKLCPDARICYCDGYGICFTTSGLFEKWFDDHHHWNKAVKELEKWNERAKLLEASTAGKDIEYHVLDIPPPGRNWELQVEIDERLAALAKLRTQALKNGTDPERDNVGNECLRWDFSDDLDHFFKRLYLFMRKKRAPSGRELDSALTDFIIETVKKQYAELYNSETEVVSQGFLKALAADDVMLKGFVDRIADITLKKTSREAKKKIVELIADQIKDSVGQGAANNLGQHIGHLASTTAGTQVATIVSHLLMKLLIANMGAIVAKVLASAALQHALMLIAKKFVLAAVTGAVLNFLVVHFGAVLAGTSVMWIVLPAIAGYMAYKIATFPKELGKAVSKDVRQELEEGFDTMNKTVLEKIFDAVFGSNELVEIIAKDNEFQSKLITLGERVDSKLLGLKNGRHTLVNIREIRV